MCLLPNPGHIQLVKKKAYDKDPVMVLIVCLDDQNGMLFNKRRQSMDQYVRERIIELCSQQPLWMNSYSAGQFSEILPNFQIVEDFLDQADAGAYCFVENVDVTPVSDRVEKIIIFRWNRRYPADVKFPIALFSNRWRLDRAEDFVGSSHERITQEVYLL